MKIKHANFFFTCQQTLKDLIQFYKYYTFLISASLKNVYNEYLSLLLMLLSHFHEVYGDQFWEEFAPKASVTKGGHLCRNKQITDCFHHSVTF